MECLKFGFLETRNRVLKNTGQFGLHLQCPWRLTNDSEIIIGSDDLFEQIDPNANYDENFNWDVTNGNLRDIMIRDFIKENKPIIETTTIDNYGGLEIGFNNNIKLSILPWSFIKMNIMNFGDS